MDEDVDVKAVVICNVMLHFVYLLYLYQVIHISKSA